MRSKEVKNAINDLFHLQHINTYLDLNKDNFQIKRETIIEWSKSTETVLSYIEELEKNNKDYDLIMKKQYEHLKNSVDKQIIRDKIKELEEERRKIESSPYDKWDLYKVIGKIEVLKSIIGE